MNDPERLQAIIDRAIDAGLFDHRTALLRRLPNRIRGDIALTARPTDQLRHDLSFLHGLPAQHKRHLIGWLKAAAGLTQSAERAFFNAQAVHFEDLHPPPGLRLRWRFAPHTPPLGDVRFPLTTRSFTLGRRHLGDWPADFVPLVSAPWRISPLHVQVAIINDQLRVTRPDGAGMLGCEAPRKPHWFARNTSRDLGRVADLDLAGALRVLIELTPESTPERNR